MQLAQRQIILGALDCTHNLPELADTMLALGHQSRPIEGPPVFHLGLRPLGHCVFFSLPHWKTFVGHRGVSRGSPLHQHA